MLFRSTNRYCVGDSGFSHMYLADDMSEAIITDNRRHLLYQKPLKGFTYQQMKDAFQNSFAGVHQDTYWDLAIPWYDGTLIGCFESYNLLHIRAMDNLLLGRDIYNPGISILNCNFRNAYMSDETREITSANGGIPQKVLLLS